MDAQQPNAAADLIDPLFNSREMIDINETCLVSDIVDLHQCSFVRAGANLNTKR